jgi:hypothetical protein
VSGRGYGGPANGLYEPFRPGNAVAEVHGARREGRIGPLAEQFRLRLLASDTTPDYLRDASYTDAIMAYCRALAIVKLLWDWLDGQDIETAMTDLTTEEEDEERSYSRSGDEGGSRRRTKRRTVSKHVSSVLDQLHKHETRAMTLRGQLGLTPLSRARMSRDVTAAKFDLARAIAELEDAPRKEDADA